VERKNCKQQEIAQGNIYHLPYLSEFSGGLFSVVVGIY
jgi:hypothetical protein